MVRLQLITTGCVIAAFVLTKTAAAQEANDHTTVLLVPGIVYQYAIFGDDSPRSDAGPGLTIGAQVRAPRSGPLIAVAEVMLQPNAVKNPHYPERFLPLYIQGGAQFGGRFYVRPSGGVGIQSGQLTPVLGVAIGRQQVLATRFRADVEFVIRVSASHGLAGVVAGLHIPIGSGARTND
jgi:hypothetical protein